MVLCLVELSNDSIGLSVAAHDWPTMSTLVTDYIKSLNFIYRNGLRSARVRYEEGYASLVDAHTIQVRTGQAMCVLH